jgi:cold shock CspA family protein
MKKRNDIKKEVKKFKNLQDSKLNKRKNQNEVDLWKEIRTNLKPLGKAYNKFRDKRRIAKQKEEERRLREEEKQRLREEEALRLQQQEERRSKKEKRIKEEKERKLKAQEDQRLENKRIIDERDELIRQEQIYRERLIKGEEERIKLLTRVNESREEERKLRDKRNLKINSEFAEKQNPENENKEQILKDEEQRLKKEEQRLKEIEQRLKKKEQSLIKDEKINLEGQIRLKADGDQGKKRLNGTVLWFNDAKGFGFIKREDKETDVFVHFSAVQNAGLSYLKEADELTFEVEYSDKGPTAVNLQKRVNETSLSHLKVIK